MKEDNVIELVQPGEFKDHLTEVLRQGAQTLVLQAVEAEFAAFLENHSDEKLEDGRKRVVRHGHLPVCNAFNLFRSATLIFSGF